jgi:hypothetical protein
LETHVYRHEACSAVSAIGMPLERNTGAYALKIYTQRPEERSDMESAGDSLAGRLRNESSPSA